MRVYVYPVDTGGCGYFRCIWPAEALRRAGHDVKIVMPSERRLPMDILGDEVYSVAWPPDADVLVLSRVTSRFVMQAVELAAARGTAVVIDVDDDLSAIHPSNPAWNGLHPRGERGVDHPAGEHRHSWEHLRRACRAATLVTVSTPALLPRYAPHGRGRVIPNTLPAHYYDLPPREDSAVVGWPGTMYSHPNDPQVVGPAVARLVREGVSFRVAGNSLGAGRAFGLDRDPPDTGDVDLLDWPRAVARLGVGLTPLADTRFNASKSWLKPLELSACGVPWVGSPRAEYVRLLRLASGVGAGSLPGLLADRPRDWYRHLRRLVDDAGLRAGMSDAGRTLAASLRLEDHAWRWWEAWSDAVELTQRNTRTAGTERPGRSAGRPTT